VSSVAPRSHRPPIGLVAPAVVAALVALAPIVYLIDRASTAGWRKAWDEIAQRRTVDLVTRSLGLMVIATTLCVVLGVAAAVLVTRTDLPGARVWQVVLALPLAIPTYLAAYAWVSVRPSLAGMGGATLVLVVCSYPYVFLPVAAALRRIDRASEEVARASGHSALSVVWRITLPQVRTAIASGALLVALYVLSDFGAVATMRFESFTWVIYGAYNAGFNPSRAAVLALVLVALAVVITVAETRARGQATTRLGGGASRQGPALRLGRWRWPWLGALSAVVAVAIGFPVASLVRWLSRSVDVDTDWSGFRRAIVSSLTLATFAAVATVAVALPAGILAARHRSRVSSTVERTTYIAHALPGIVIAIAIVHLGIRLVPSLYQRTPMLVLAYAVIFLPLAVGNVRAAFEQCPPRLEEVARSLGRSQRRATIEVVARLAAPGIAAGAALTFLATMKELPATLLLHPTGTETLATRLWTFTSVSDYGGAAPYAAALMLFAAVPTAVLGWLTGRLDGHA
jgi:iron(III) transport system permease protein